MSIDRHRHVIRHAYRCRYVDILLLTTMYIPYIHYINSITMSKQSKLTILLI